MIYEENNHIDLNFINNIRNITKKVLNITKDKGKRRKFDDI